MARPAPTGPAFFIAPAAVHYAALLWALAAAFLLVLPADALPGAWMPGTWMRHADKVGHAALFFVGAGLVHRSLRALSKARRPLGWAVVLVVLHGAVLEALQALTGRDPSAADLLADAAGAGLYLALRVPGACQRRAKA